MSRLLFIVAIIAVVYFFLKSYRKQSPRKGASPDVQDMVSCANCGINLPKNESVTVNGKYYCCAAHSRSQEK